MSGSANSGMWSADVEGTITDVICYEVMDKELTEDTECFLEINEDESPPWHEINADALMYVFKLLNDDDLSSAGQVCSHWRDVAEGNSVRRQATITCNRSVRISQILKKVQKMSKLKRLRLVFTNGPIRLDVGPKKFAIQKELEEIKIVGAARWMMTTANGDLICPLRRIAFNNERRIILRPVRTPSLDFVLKIQDYFPRTLIFSPQKFSYIFDPDSVEKYHTYLGARTLVTITDMFFKNSEIVEDHIIFLTKIFRNRITDVILNNIRVTWNTMRNLSNCTNLERLVICYTTNVCAKQICNVSSLQNLKILQLGTLDESSWRIWNRVLRQVSWQKPVTKFRIVRKKRAHEEYCGVLLDIEFEVNQQSSQSINYDSEKRSTSSTTI